MSDAEKIEQILSILTNIPVKDMTSIEHEIYMLLLGAE